VVVAAEDGSVSAIDPATGTSLWTANIGAGVDTSSAATDDTVVVGSQTGQVVALSAADGSLVWRTDTGDAARVGTPAISDGHVYIATLDGGGPDSNHIRRLDLATGATMWTFASPGSVPSYSPAIVDGLAITEGESGAVTALDIATGSVAWQSQVQGIVEIVPAVAGGVVYGAGNDSAAYALAASTGEQLWQVPIDGTPYGAAVTGGLMLVGTNVGKLYAIGGEQQ
jgi:outer membrane protein assembly factor BamB